MNIVAIIQARMSSSRLPGKVMKKLGNKFVLEHVVTRLKYSSLINKIVVATSIDISDNVIEAWCKVNSTLCYRGSLHDVLDRYFQAANFYNADAIVRITADCPLIDPFIVDEVIKNFINGKFDFYCLSGEFPDGLDCSVFSMSAIRRAWNDAKLPSEREHVGPYIEKHPEIFKLGGLEKFSGLYNYRWTLDDENDLHFLEKIFFKLSPACNGIILTDDILNLLKLEPDLMQINSNTIRNEGYLKSLKVDNI